MEFDAARGRRLREAMTAAGVKVAVLAHYSDVSEKTVSRWISGAKINKESYIDVICQRCEVSREYLLTGKSVVPENLVPKQLAYAGSNNLGDGTDVTFQSLTPSSMTDNDSQTGQGKQRLSGPEEQLSINNIPIHRLHVALIRYVRSLPEREVIAVWDRVINNRFAGHIEPYRTGHPIIDDRTLDRYEIAAVLSLRAIENPAHEISLINGIMQTRPPTA